MFLKRKNGKGEKEDKEKEESSSTSKITPEKQDAEPPLVAREGQIFVAGKSKILPYATALSSYGIKLVWNWVDCTCYTHNSLPSEYPDSKDYTCEKCQTTFRTTVAKMGGGYMKCAPRLCYNCAMKDQTCGAGCEEKIPEEFKRAEREGIWLMELDKFERDKLEDDDKKYIVKAICRKPEEEIVIGLFTGAECAQCKATWLTRIVRHAWRPVQLCFTCATESGKCGCCMDPLA